MKSFVLLLIVFLWIPLASQSAEFNWNELVLTYTSQGPDIIVQYCANEDGELILLVVSKGPEGSTLVHFKPVEVGTNKSMGSHAHIETAGKIHPPPTIRENFAYVENGVVYRGTVKLKKAELTAYIQGYLAGFEKGKNAKP